MVAEVDFMLCVVAFLLAACVVVPVAAVTILAVTGRKPSPRAAVRDHHARKPGAKRGEAPVPPGLSLPPADV